MKIYLLFAVILASYSHFSKDFGSIITGFIIIFSSFIIFLCIIFIDLIAMNIIRFWKIVRSTFVSSFSCLLKIFGCLAIDVRISAIGCHKMLVRH